MANSETKKVIAVSAVVSAAAAVVAVVRMPGWVQVSPYPLVLSLPFSSSTPILVLAYSLDT
ncbi:hypothetical protein F4809DRAFT_621110 [Biscogniauxia mediterranea]|nr:hypothetical protein F4809DRAFT_621110 [Biscogniauxia mediterranea]